jgi:hypothetical protein
MDLSLIYDGGVYKFCFASGCWLQSGSSSGGSSLSGARFLTLLIQVALHRGVGFG